MWWSRSSSATPDDGDAGSWNQLVLGPKAWESCFRGQNLAYDVRATLMWDDDFLVLDPLFLPRIQAHWHVMRRANRNLFFEKARWKRGAENVD